jgi:hypothetical protein
MFKAILMALLYVAFICFGLLQLACGFWGIEDAAGKVWAWLSLIAAVSFRFTIPITVGVFLCATNVFHWDWWWAALFAAPGLIFIVPGILVSILSWRRF